jgi:hypothetical protein
MVQILEEGRDFSHFEIRATWHWGPLFNGCRQSFQGVYRPELEVDLFPPSSTEVKNEWNCVSTPPLCFHGMERDRVCLPFTDI